MNSNYPTLLPEVGPQFPKDKNQQRSLLAPGGGKGGGGHSEVEV